MGTKLAWAVLPIVFVLSSPARCKILSGIGVLYQGGWDFSEQQTVHSMFDPATDLSIVLVVDPPFGPWQFGENGARITEVPDSNFAELTTAPEDSTRYLWELPALVGVTYVIRTIEHCYAKYRILSIYPPAIEYAFQDNGSRVLDPGVPVEPTTWGRIKELYGE